MNLLNADAKVTVISPRDGLNAEVAHRIERKQVEHLDKKFEPSDLDDPHITMVLTAIDEPEASTEVWKLCKERRIPANIADVPPECDFYFGSVHRDGPLQIMVSTNGNGPKMANIVRKRIAASLPPNIGDAIAKVGELRKRLRLVAPGNEEGPKRMKWYAFCRTDSVEYLLIFTGCRKFVCSGVWRTCAKWKKMTWMSSCNLTAQIWFQPWSRYDLMRSPEYRNSMGHLDGHVSYSWWLMPGLGRDNRRCE